MKKVVTILLLLQLIMSCSTKSNVKNIKTDWDENGLKGSVKSVTTTLYAAVNDSGKWINGNQIYRSEIIFDKVGKELQTKSYNGMDSLSFVKSLDYDVNGNVVKITQIYSDSGNSKAVYNYTYDSKNRLLKESLITVNSNGLESDTVVPNRYRYLDNGTVVITRMATSGSGVIYRDSCIYDKAGNKIEEYQYVEDNKNYSYRNLLIYNAMGKVEEDLSYNENNEKIGYVVYKYNEHGNIIETSQYDKDNNLIQRKITKYNQEDDPIEQIVYDNGKQQFIDRYSYMYDDQNNWIKETIFDKENNPQYFQERVIIYY